MARIEKDGVEVLSLQVSLHSLQTHVENRMEGDDGESTSCMRLNTMPLAVCKVTLRAGYPRI